MKKLLPLLLPAVWTLFGCAGSPTSGNSAPLWVSDAEQAYPNSEWISYTGSGRDRNSAESAAIKGLAQRFHIDATSIASSNQQYARSVSSSSGKKVEISTQNREFALELVSVSNVSGLIGVQTETWTARDGTVHVNVRMNRSECSERYTAMIRENEGLIRSLKQEAAKTPETFDAYQMLNFAFNAAQLTDNFYLLLRVLDPATASKRPEYGNADTVKALAQNAARSIVVTVKIQGDDVDGRISKAFSSYLTRQGFRINTTGANSYTLNVLFKMEDLDLANERYKYVSYVLNYSVKNKSGLEVFSGSDTGREGHATTGQARQRVVSVAETSIGSTGFAKQFDEYLASLL